MSRLLAETENNADGIAVKTYYMHTTFDKDLILFSSFSNYKAYINLHASIMTEIPQCHASKTFDYHII